MNLPELKPIRCWYRRLASRAAPLAVFEELYKDEPQAFLYESLEAHGGRGRYSFIGSRPRAILRARGRSITLQVGDQLHETEGDPLEALRALNHLQDDAPPVAPFCGGPVGYLAYDTVRWTENIPADNPDELDEADAHFLLPGEVVCFDHRDKLVHVVLYRESGHEERLREIQAVLDRSQRVETNLRQGASDVSEGEPLPLESNMTRDEFEAMVRRAKEYILAGDIFQVVLSQRFSFPVRVPPVELYRALRITNPSPYMYYLRLGDVQIVGSSPEILVQKLGRKVVTRPLAGTRPRGATEEEDQALAAELQADEKERAEHVMLVDLGRNDLGRVCDFQSIELTDVLAIERHSKVMHLVSNVEGWLQKDRDAFDVFQAVFPAGTLSGAPKVRAMEIIEELEPAKRGIFGGAIGYFSVLGDLDLCIAIRTMVIHGDRGYIQAGAGIVADSHPASEYQETINKARGVLRAVQLAEQQHR